MGSRPVAVLLMAYGSAPSADEAGVRAYLDHILRFYRRAAPTGADVRHLLERYRAVGGSPLYAVTRRIVQGVAAALAARARATFQVHLAMKHSPPFIEEQVRRIAADGGAEQAVAVALAPFRSRLSTEGYYGLVRETNEALERPLAWRYADDWHLDPAFLGLWAERVRAALGGGDRLVIFTNHSLPARIREWDDPYERVFAETARALADRLALRAWSTAYQSAGGGGQAWLGPSIEEVLRRERDAGHRAALLAPIGFLMDHLEVLYDLDIGIRGLAGALGMDVQRTEMPNDDPALIALLADMVEQTAAAEA